MSRTITCARRRGMTVEQYLEFSEREYDDMQDRYRLITNRQLQLAVITQHAARNGRVFTRWDVS